MKSLIRLIAVSSACICAVALRAEQPLTPPAPLTKPGDVAPPGTSALIRTSADFALELGFSSQAADLYRTLLAQPGTDRAGLTLALATALLEAGRADEAEKALLALPEPHTAAWHLRLGLAAVQLKKNDIVRAALPINESELSAADYPWYWFLQGAYVDLFSPQDIGRSNDFYLRAEKAATNELARARFKIAADEVRFRSGVASTPEQLQVMRQNVESQLGTAVGYGLAKRYLEMLLAANQKEEAVKFLLTWVPSVPRGDAIWWHDFRYWLGVFGDRGRNPNARRALVEILEQGSDPLRQRQALELLWEAGQQGPAREQLRALLDRLTAPSSKHPILESLLFYRAQLALLEKKYDDVAAKAGELLTKFPGSPLRVQALGLLTRLAWEQQKFRTAADNARKARAELLDAKEPRLVAARAELTLVEAEAWFRAGVKDGDRNDFRNAADAYDAALRERPANVQPGDLMFQRVLAEIKAGAAGAVQVLDQLEADPAFDAQNRWEAEWSLARALKIEGRTNDAYARVTKLLAEKPAGGVAADLRGRMAWLQARLSLDANQPQQTLTLVDALLGTLGDLEPNLRAEIASTALLRKAEAQLRLGRESAGNRAKEYETAALTTLQKLRTDFASSDAAVESYIVEAQHYADSDRIQEAQKTLTALTENTAYKDRIFVPYAFYQLALLSERLGQQNDLEQAHRRIEELVTLVQKNPATAASQAELVFVARMKEGELLRRLNELPAAQRVYEALTAVPAPLENDTQAKLELAKNAQAKLELAKTHNAQSAGDPSLLHLDRAQSLFAELSERADVNAALPDVSVEAGYNLGLILIRRGKPEDAARVWWRDVITRFLIEDKQRTELGATRPYWLARTLISLGELYEQQGRYEDARHAYQLIATSGLAGEALARKALERLGLPGARN